MSAVTTEQTSPRFVFTTHPDRYKHLQLKIEGPVAHLLIAIDEDAGAVPGYQLKLNSYDIGVDIELADAVNRLRFEHPEVSVVCVQSARDDIFSAGANIFMLGQSSHGHKVNFCKYTNETRLNLEEATKKSGQTYIAALNGTASGGGYELALACEEIYLIDDRNSAVSLPELPYLGVLPGTGGLTRLVDKRKVRRDHADVFCTLAEGIKGKRAVDWKLVDGVFPKSQWDEKIAERLTALSEERDLTGVTLPDVSFEQEEDTFTYKYVTLTIDAAARTAALALRGPEAASALPDDPARLGADIWALRFWRELENALLQLRFNYDEVGLITITTSGDPAAVIALDAALEARKDHWYVRELLLFQGRVLKMLDVTARSFFALVEPGNCFAGSLFEVALASDRIYMLEDDDEENRIGLSVAQAGGFPMGNGLSRLENRYYEDAAAVAAALEHQGALLDCEQARKLGLVTEVFDSFDWEDEIRVAVEERVSFSPDALTGMEANLRFVGPETMETRIFGRLSAWQNWIFIRPNATGESGALTCYGKSSSAKFQWRRT